MRSRYGDYKLPEMPGGQLRQKSLFSAQELQEAGAPPSLIYGMQVGEISRSELVCPSPSEILKAWEGRAPIRLRLCIKNESISLGDLGETVLKDSPFADMLAESGGWGKILSFSRELRGPSAYPRYAIEKGACGAPFVVNPTAAREGGLAELYEGLEKRLLTSQGTELLSQRFGRQADDSFLLAMQHNTAILITNPEALNAIDTVVGFWASRQCDQFMVSMDEGLSKSSRLLSSIAETLDLISKRLGLIVPPEYQKPLDFSGLDRLLALYRALEGLTRTGGGAAGTEIPSLRLLDLFKGGKGREATDDLGSNVADACRSIRISLVDQPGFELDLEFPTTGAQTFAFFKARHNEFQGLTDASGVQSKDFQAANSAFVSEQVYFRDFLLELVKYNLSKIAARDDVAGLIDKIGQRVAYFDYLAAFVCTSVEAVTTRQAQFCFARPFVIGEESVSSLVARNLTRAIVPDDLENRIEVPNDTVFSTEGRHEYVRVVAAPNNAGKSHFFVGTITQSRVFVGMTGVAHASEYRYFSDGRVAMPAAISDITNKGGGFVASVNNLQATHRALKPTPRDYLLADEIGGGLANEGGEEVLMGSYIREVVSRGLHLCYLVHNRTLIESIQRASIPGVVVVNAPICFDSDGLSGEPRPRPSYKFSLGPPNWRDYEENVRYLLRKNTPGVLGAVEGGPPLISYKEPFPAPEVIISTGEILNIWSDKELIRDASCGPLTFSSCAGTYGVSFNQLKLPLEAANTPSFTGLKELLGSQALTLEGFRGERYRDYPFEVKRGRGVYQAPQMSSMRVIDDNAAQVAGVSKLFQYYLKLCISQEGCSYIKERFGKQLPPTEMAQVHRNIDRLIKNPAALQSVDLIVRIWEQLDCRSLFQLGSEDNWDISKLHQQVSAVKALMEALQVITEEVQLDLPEVLQAELDFKEYAKILHVFSACRLLTSSGGGASKKKGLFESRVPDTQLSSFLNYEGDNSPLLEQSDADTPSFQHYGEVISSISINVTLVGGLELKLELPAQFAQLAEFVNLGADAPSGASSFRDPSMWISYPATEQHELVLAVLRYNLAAISGQRGVTDLFETICGRIAYFDYLGVLASMAVHSVTVRETPLCAPSLHNVEVGPQLSSIIAREACHPFRDSDISGDEVPNDLYASGRIQISVGPCSGGKTYTFIETNVSNRVHVGLGGLPCATQYSFDPGGRTLFPVIPAEVKKTGSAFVSTIRATQEALRALAPNIHDQLLFDEFAGGVSNEGGEFEVAETLLKGLAQIGCTITYITHNTLLATHFSELGLPSAVLLHAGIDHHLGGPILTYQQRVGPPDWGLYAEHLEKLIRAHKPNWWIDDSAPPGME